MNGTDEVTAQIMDDYDPGMVQPDGETPEVEVLPLPQFEYDYLYVFNIYWEQPVYGAPKFHKLFGEYIKKQFGEASEMLVTKPIIGLMFKFDHQLDKNEEIEFMLALETNLTERKIMYSKLEVAHVERKVRDNGQQDIRGGTEGSDEGSVGEQLSDGSGDTAEELVGEI